MSPAQALLENGHPGVKRDQKHTTKDLLRRPVISPEEAFGILGVNRGTGYRAIREGTFPVPVLRVGRSIRIPTVGLLRLLLLIEDPAAENRKDD